MTWRLRFMTCTTSMLTGLLLLAAPMASWGQAPEVVPYSSRSDFLRVSAIEAPDFQSGMQGFFQSQIGPIALYLELYPDHEIYFLARDAEYLYDLARYFTRNEPAQGRRLHLLNVSRKNMGSQHLKAYLEQEGITEEALRLGKRILFVDSGFEGTIPARIQSHYPKELRSQMRTHLLSSNVRSHPSTKVYKAHPSYRRVLDYENIPHQTDVSFMYQRIGERWEPVSRPKSDGGWDPASLFQRQLKYYAELPETEDYVKKTRAAWRSLESAYKTGSESNIGRAFVGLFRPERPLHMSLAMIEDFIQTKRTNFGTKFSDAIFEPLTRMHVSSLDVRINRLPILSESSQIKTIIARRIFAEGTAAQVRDNATAFNFWSDKALLQRYIATPGTVQMNKVALHLSDISDPEIFDYAVKQILKRADAIEIGIAIDHLRLKNRLNGFGEEIIDALRRIPNDASRIATSILSAPSTPENTEVFRRLIEAGWVKQSLAPGYVEPNWVVKCYRSAIRNLVGKKPSAKEITSSPLLNKER